MSSPAIRVKNLYTTDTMSERAFCATLGLYVVLGLLGSVVSASLTYHTHLNWLIVVCGIGLPIIGFIVSANSSDWVVSSFGYALVCLPFGSLLGPVCSRYHFNSLIQVVAVTLVVSTCMWIVGIVIPRITKNFSSYILGALLVLAAGYFAPIFIPILGLGSMFMTLWSWLGCFLFAGFIIYNVNAAMQERYTLNNAVNAAVGIYLDIINYFLERLLNSGVLDGSSDDSDD